MLIKIRCVFGVFSFVKCDLLMQIVNSHAIWLISMHQISLMPLGHYQCIIYKTHILHRAYLHTGGVNIWVHFPKGKCPGENYWTQ